MPSDKPLTEKRFVELINELDLATNSSVKEENEKNRKLIVESRDLLLEAVHKRMDEVVGRIDNLELNTTPRKEFEILKKQVARLTTN